LTALGGVTRLDALCAMTGKPQTPSPNGGGGGGRRLTSQAVIQAVRVPRLRNRQPGHFVTICVRFPTRSAAGWRLRERPVSLSP
jgi:hypothetical protein